MANNILSWLPVQSSIVSQNMNPSNWQNSSLFGNTSSTQSNRYAQPTDAYNSSGLFSLTGSQQNNQDQAAGLLQIISAMLIQLLNSSQSDAQAAPFSLASDDPAKKDVKSKSRDGAGGCHGKSKANKNKGHHGSQKTTEAKTDTKTQESDKTGSSACKC